MTAAIRNTFTEVCDTTIQLSPHDLRYLVNQAEVEFLGSAVCQQIVTDLQSSVGQSAEGIQAQMQALGQEAMRLILNKLCQLTQRTPPKEAKITAGQSSQAQGVSISGQGKSSNRPPSPKGFPQPDTEPESMSDVSESPDAEVVRVGLLLRQTRQAQSVSLDELHIRTCVPKHHLEALEQGQLDRLPERIYVHGFVRRMGNALGLDGNQLAARIAPQETLRGTVLASWQEEVKTRREAPPMLLYMGYAALIAGATSGLAWTTRQAEVNQIPVAPSAGSEDTSASEQRQTQTSVTGTAAISEPETIPPENNATIHPFTGSFEIQDRGR